ncbi:unnamed protein product [Allacma fusca]|uniref:BCAS3 domain-containing protein n=1 Tax=Allacma fusca TaxID=39272 RepID=A0A8J2JYS1_9HEXA|nr:unnamed protein product [Allacma fusca]
MSADSLKKGPAPKGSPGLVIRPHSVTDKTFMESVAGLINEVGLVSQPHNSNEDKENKVLWTRIENNQNYDLKRMLDDRGDVTKQHHSSLIVTLGYPSGVQMWAIPANGDAQEILSWRRMGVRIFQLLPTPSDFEKDRHRASRPAVALCESSGASSSTNNLTFMSLRTGDVLKTSKFSHPICDILTNSDSLLISFLDKIIVIDVFTFDVKVTIITSEYSLGSPGISPVALGSSWLAFADRKLYSSIQSTGGVEPAGTPSYTATVLYAAKSLTKGLKGLGETVANSISGHRMPPNPDTQASAEPEPGVVTVVNLTELKSGEFSLNELCCANGSSQSPIIAHFVAHLQHPVLAMSFDPSGLLLVTADKGGHDFHVFRIHPHPWGSSMGAVHHLYVLHRGDTGAKVQDISFAPDSRWVAVSTKRGTTHIFPITPYGGAISVRTHTSNRVVNRLSRFHKTAGLDDSPVSGRHSPVMSSYNTGSVAGGNGKSVDQFHVGSPYPNPRLPPFPHPIVVPPLAQLRQSYVGVASSPKSSPPCRSKGLLPVDERVHVNSLFEVPRGWLLSNPAIVPSCDNRRKSPIDALFVLSSHGNLVEYSLEPRSQSGTPKDKVSDDAQVELSVHAVAQWNFTRPSFAKDLQPPLGVNNLGIFSNTLSNNVKYNCENSYDGENECIPEEEHMDERWLSQVEITTHSGPHRRLWMGPQFTFKVFNSSGSSKSQGTCAGMVDVETVEVSVKNRPAKSNSVNMPVSSSILPEVIVGSSGSSIEQSPRLFDPYYDAESCTASNESLIKENLAEAMMENCNVSRDIAKGGCQSLGSADELSSSSFDSASQNSIDAPLVPNFCMDVGFPD